MNAQKTYAANDVAAYVRYMLLTSRNQIKDWDSLYSNPPQQG